MGKAARGVYFLSSPSAEALYDRYPYLRASEHKITSQRDDRYNCVAWVQREMNRWFEPEIFWPRGVPEPEGAADLDCYIALFRAWGFEDCDSTDLEDGYLKIAIFATGDECDHVAKQLPSGAWSSKAGTLYDVKHQDLDALCGSWVMPHTSLVRIMRRHFDGTDPHEIEEQGLVGLPD